MIDINEIEYDDLTSGQMQMIADEYDEDLDDAVALMRHCPGPDFGLVIGAGYGIRKDLSVDLRAVHGLRNFDGPNDRLLYQVSLGVSYIY